jgi:signal transduction histidine kinase
MRMTGPAARLLYRVVAYEALLTLATTILAALLAPRLLLLRADESEAAALTLAVSIGAGGVLAALRTGWVLSRHRAVVRALAEGCAVSSTDLERLTGEIWRVTATWIAPPLLGLALVATALRPASMPETTAVSVALLAAMVVSAAALPFHALVRTGLLRVLELADPNVMRELVERAEMRGLTGRRVARRMLAAVATPVAFVAIGSALIASAHSRRAELLQREETARALARASLDELPSSGADDDGTDEAVARARSLGFVASVDRSASDYRVLRDELGITEVLTPLDRGSARVRFAGSTVPVLRLELLLVSALAVLLAGALGAGLGRALTRDLRTATLGVRALGEGYATKGLVRDARFRVVAELGAAIENLALRFDVFARAQRRAIESQEAVTRMRGLFFASVSHDLKSPLNAILGFTDLVRQTEALTDEQEESLEQIERSGNELLALIETILDAARVEARQLTLMKEPVRIPDLLEQAVEVGRRLGGKPEAHVSVDVVRGVPNIVADRLRLARAIATFVAHGLRTSLGVPIRVTASPLHGGRSVEIHVHLAAVRASAHQLDSILDPTRRPDPAEPRGLALGLGLARTIIELHGGKVRLIALNETITSVMIELPALIRPG